MKTPKIKTKKFKEFLKRLLWLMAEKAFLTFLGLLFIALIFGVITYYSYQTLLERTEPQIVPQIVAPPLQFQQKTYESILRIWQERERKFNEANSKEFPELPKTSPKETTPPEEPSSSLENIQLGFMPQESVTFMGATTN